MENTMRLKFRSNLGPIITHKVTKVGLNSYETTSRSKLLLIVSGLQVSIAGGHALYQNNKWITGPKHFFSSPISLGELIGGVENE